MAFTPSPRDEFSTPFSRAERTLRRTRQRLKRRGYAFGAGLSLALTAWAAADAPIVQGWQAPLPICAPAAQYPATADFPALAEIPVGDSGKLFNVLRFVCPVTAALPSARIGVRHATNLLSGQPSTAAELNVTAPAGSTGTLRAQGTFQLLVPSTLVTMLNRYRLPIPSGVISLVLSSVGSDGSLTELARHSESLATAEMTSYTWAIEVPAQPAGTRLRVTYALHLSNASQVIEALPAGLRERVDQLNPIFVLKDLRLSGEAHFSTNQPTVSP
jgi:hypothetical protein